MLLVNRLVVFSLVLMPCVAIRASAEPQSLAVGLEAGAKQYQPCSACHLPSGEGIPGAFPPLVGRMEAVATSDEGRQYLVSVVTRGLNGPIQVGDSLYSGFMQGFQSSMSDRDVSDVLNYVVLGLGGVNPDKADAEQFAPFSEQEVTSLRQSLDGHDATSHQLRTVVALLN